MEQDRKDQAPLTGGVDDDLEGGTTGAASMTGGDRDDPSDSSKPAMFGAESREEAAPGGRWNQGASEADLGPIGTQSASGSPAGDSGGGRERGPAANGSFASGTYNERGDVTGPDSPAGADARLSSDSEGQGDDLANRLGGGEGRGAGMTGGGSASGDMSADRSEAGDESALNRAGAGGPDAGSPGGMGGARARSGATGTGRPPGGVSPIQPDDDGA